MNVGEITRRVDLLIKRLERGIEAILDGMTAEEPYVAALFDCSDPQGMQIYHELGFEPAGTQEFAVLDVLESSLLGVLRKHWYVPLDEMPSYEPGTVLLYVFTCDVVVARRFESVAGVGRGLREVRRMRDVQFEPFGFLLEGQAANDLIIQRCGEVLRSLWDGTNERVAVIHSASHGAKAGYLDRRAAIQGFRSMAAHASTPDRDSYLGMADALASGPRPGTVQCIILGWGAEQVVTLALSSLAASPAGPAFGKREEDLLGGYIIAFRDRNRAVGFFEKRLNELGSSPAHTAVAELAATLRHHWKDTDAILAKIPIVAEQLLLSGSTDAISRLQLALTALRQATTDRKCGWFVNAPGGLG